MFKFSVFLKKILQFVCCPLNFNRVIRLCGRALSLDFKIKRTRLMLERSLWLVLGETLKKIFFEKLFI